MNVAARDTCRIGLGQKYFFGPGAGNAAEGYLTVHGARATCPGTGYIKLIPVSWQLGVEASGLNDKQHHGHRR